MGITTQPQQREMQHTFASSTETQIAIIGCGPRGLNLLDRICNFARGCDGEVVVHVVDPGNYGEGAHPSEQPGHLWINTVAEQVTMFADSSVDQATFGSIVQGPSLFEWIVSEGYTFDPDTGTMSKSEGGRAITNNDYVPRALLGAYLNWFYKHTVSNAPKNLRVVEHKGEALSIRGVPNVAGQRFNIQLSTGDSLHKVDLVYVTTGHTKNPLTEEELGLLEHAASAVSSGNKHARFIPKAYPVSQCDPIEPEAVVAVEGFGLTAHDVVAQLTCGRGGRFERGAGGALSYVPSGREPRQIVMYSRTGLPFSGRAVNEKGLCGRVKPTFLTQDAIRSLKNRTMQTRGSPQLDFEHEVYPLILKEMEFVYYKALLIKSGQKAAAIQFARDATCSGTDSFDKAVMAACGTLGVARNKLQHILNPLQGREFNDATELRAFMTEYLKQDIADAYEGNIHNPNKAATDVLRDIRDNLRDCVDHRGLTPQSWGPFKAFINVMNRIAVGPPKLRNEQLLALVECGLVELATGPKAVVSPVAGGFTVSAACLAEKFEYQVDVLIRSRIDSFDVSSSSSPLIQSLVSNNLGSAFSNGACKPGGLNISRNNCLVDGAGSEISNCFVLGTPAEGPNWYTYVLPRPGVGSRSLIDAGNAVRQGLAEVERMRLTEAKVAANAMQYPPQAVIRSMSTYGRRPSIVKRCSTSRIVMQDLLIGAH